MTLPCLFGDAGGLWARRWFLRVVDGNEAGHRVALTGTALVGAAPSALLVLTDDTVSRYHAELEPLPHGVRVRDLDSTNGTFFGVDGLRVSVELAREGQEIVLGSARVILEAERQSISVRPRPARADTFGALTTRAPSMRTLFALARAAAASDSSVWLEGELGTGKAQIAMAMHAASPRAAGGFLRLDARSLRGEAASLEALLGRGTRPGVLEHLAGGTLFIEHAHRLSAAAASVLSETLDRGRFTRVDDPEPRPLDVRFMLGGEAGATPPVGLEERFGAIRLRLPPLFERREDLVPLAEELLAADGRRVPVGPRVAAVLLEERWPGNVPELRGTLRAMLEPRAPGAQPFLDRLEGLWLEDLMENYSGHVTRAATAVGTTTRALFAALHRHDVELDAA